MIRWTLTRHFLGHFGSEMRDRAGLSTESDLSHEEMKPAAMTRDNQQVSDLIDHIINKMTDPFDVTLHPVPLINISTGMHASKEVQDSLLNSINEGTQRVKSFVDGSLSNGQSRSFYNPISRSKLKSFEDMTKKTKLKCRSGDTVNVHINPELVFRRALALANCREDVTVEKVLSYPIGPIPTSMFHDDGTMRKTCKADLAHILEQDVVVCQILSIFDISRTTHIRDGMALLQSINAKRFKTFGELALDFVRNQVACFQYASVVADIFDRYDIQNSIKSSERERRSKSFFNPKVFQVIEGRIIPDWKKFLSSGENKQSLIKFLGEFTLQYMKENSCLMDGQKLYLAGSFPNPEIVKIISPKGISDCSELSITQEEADTRIILHAFNADKLYRENDVNGRIIVKSPDTDVLVLLIHYFPQMTHISELWFQTGMITSIKDCRRYIPVHELCGSLNSVLCKILPAAHAITGCDTTSSLFGIGKKSMLKALKETPVHFNDLSQISLLDIEDSEAVSRKLVTRLYDPKGKSKRCHTNLNSFRVKLATCKDSSLVRLPPCEASFKQHVLRSSFQTKIWMTAHIAKSAIGSPLQFGWKEGKCGLEPVLFEGQMSSDFLQDLVCTCKGKSVCSKSCVCFEQKLSCTELCQCQASDLCKNLNTHLADIDDDDDA